MEDTKFWREFITMYRNMEQLWNPKYKLYKNRMARDEAYNVLVKKLKEINPHANQLMVRKRINIMRTRYRRELHKIEESKDSGYVYKTKLWYFNLLTFLFDEYKPRDARHSFEESHIKTSDYTLEDDLLEEVDETHHKKLRRNYLQEVEDLIEVVEESPQKNARKDYSDEDDDFMEELAEIPRKTVRKESSLQDDVDEECVSPARKTRSRESSQTNELIKLVTNRLKETENNHDTVSLSQAWGNEFNGMRSEQKLIVKKLFSDLLYYGTLGMLNQTHVSEINTILNFSSGRSGTSRVYSEEM